MSSDPGLFIELGLLVFTAAMFGFSSFRAYRARSALFTAVYRDRALWNAILGLAFVPFPSLITVYFAASGLPAAEQYAVEAYIVVFNICSLLFIDSVIRAALDIDFLHRDPFRWTKTRWVAVGLFVIGVVGTFFGPQGGQSYVISSEVIWPVSFLYCVIVLLSVSPRVRDHTMRAYLLWVTAAGFFVVLPFFVRIFVSGPYQLLAIYAIGSLVFYRACTSLLRTSRIAQEALTGVQAPKQVPGIH
jgi:NADH:ubiquinone oxidoreductase subunit K